MFNFFSLNSFFYKNRLDDLNADVVIGDSNNNNGDNNEFKYTKIVVNDPSNNRKLILNNTKNKKGVYVWESLDGKNLYVGHSINLYNRISSYFMSSILKTKSRRVLRYLNKYGFNNLKLTIYIMDDKSTLDEVVSLEQHFMDTLNPNLNVDPIASSSGFHTPMSIEIREKLRKERGTPVYIYNSVDFSLLHLFESKQYVYNSINIHHKILNDCLSTGTLYLDTFFFSLDLIKESPNNANLISLAELKELVKEKRDKFIVKHPAAKIIIAEYKDDPSKNLEFSSLNSLATHLKGDRQVIREYLKGNTTKYYRGKWKFRYKN
uniref:GIY endonuclease n=3 Tax=Ceratocystis TaxID=5157 RepID=A0A5C1V9M1_9PEZI|nr:GIY endonuclease [Ceratocystis cacaofunesta]YP_009704205.1 GIY endonuclease [Ceratocystis fimbriata]YP_009710357.1 GIY endonuclease [Ceratocystis albifundus]AFO38118.1 GIY endonuclease [Ceratocystis cacaofunesta]QEN73768.1 GIY endonuclease [Ceratocystis fimbriata]QFX74859.1 GIY endonuclease [Ceratocystis albifundus]